MSVRINSDDDLLAAIDEYGILPFWDENGFSAWQLCDVNFMKLWYMRERVVNTKKIAYGKFVHKKATFVRLDLLPALCALRRDGYDFDSLCDEGRVPNREKIVMDAVDASSEPAPSYQLSKSIGIKGYDTCVTSLQNKTYLCVTFKHSYMGSALLSRPETLFGYDFVRSAYDKTNEQNAAVLANTKGLQQFTDEEVKKILTPAV